MVFNFSLTETEYNNANPLYLDKYYKYRKPHDNPPPEKHFFS